METGKIQITLAVIAMISGWGIALITNWSSLFSEVQADPVSDVKMIEQSKFDSLNTKYLQILAQLDSNQSILQDKEASILDLNQNILELKAPFHLISNTKLKQLLKFHNSAVCYGSSLNLTHPAGDDYQHCQSKEALSKKLLLFFEELELVEDNASNYSTERAKNALIRLQSNYKFNNPGWYTDLMLGILIIEYVKKS